MRCLHTGGKFANWEGGIRVVGLVTGGALPVPRRGQQEWGLIAVWDWLPTYASLAGVEVRDPVAAAAGLPPPLDLPLQPNAGDDAEEGA